ncbi:MAG: hypothetical protein WBB67_11285 [bacterium]
MKIFNEISRLPEFNKELKRLLKRFRTLEQDFEIFIEKQLNLYYKLKKDNKGIVRLTDLQIENPEIYKARKFACRALTGGAYSDIRVIYAYFEEIDKIELIEIYYKGDKKNEDRKRIFKYYSK